MARRTIRSQPRRAARVPRRVKLAPGEPAYAGMWVDDEPCVTVTRAAKTAPLESDLRAEERYSPHFAWGFAGPSSRQLAQAILADYFSDHPDGLARSGRQVEAFHLRIVSLLPAVWTLRGEDIGDFLLVAGR